MLQAFVGYKDHADGNERIMLHKFVCKEDISSIQDFVAKIQAGGGADGPEDIAGALQVRKQYHPEMLFACLHALA